LHLFNFATSLIVLLLLHFCVFLLHLFKFSTSLIVTFVSFFCIFVSFV
jgi:hypothetical protein